MGFTQLIWAAQRGNQEVVRLLLAQDDVNPDKLDNDGQTPLWWASYRGYEGVARYSHGTMSTPTGKGYLVERQSGGLLRKGMRGW